MKNANMHRAN